MSRSFTFVLLLVVCFVCIGPLAAQNDTARVRIGYFAFDPREYDTFIDGELAPFNVGWDAAGWLAFITPGTDGTRVCCSATPYMDIPASAHSVAFVPRGAGIEEAIANPIQVTLDPEHTYSLAVVGELDDDTLTIFPVDETQMDLSESTEILINDLPGAGAITLDGWKPDTVQSVDYEQVALGAWPADTGHDYTFTFTSDSSAEPTLMYTIPFPGGLSNMAAFTGTYPGVWGEDYIYAWNTAFPGELALVEGTALTLGAPVTESLTSVGQRFSYPLTLDTDQVVNVYASVTGPATGGWDLGYFDTMVYVYDAQGNLLFWNDDLASAVGVAGMEGIALPAGNYVVQVGSFADSMAGPFELLIEAAQ